MNCSIVAAASLAVMQPAKRMSRRRVTKNAEPDPIAAGVGLLAGFVGLDDFLAEKRAEARREDRKWGIRRSRASERRAVSHRAD